MRCQRAVAGLLIGAALLAGTACGGGGSSPADTITQPIDKARTTADQANQRQQQIDARYGAQTTLPGDQP